MDMTMKPGAPSLTQPVVVRPRAGSSTSVDSGSEFPGGVALSPTINQNETTSSSKRQPRPSKEARIALRNERLAATAASTASAVAGSEASPIVATNSTVNSSAQNSRPSKKARKALRKKQTAQHEPAPVVTAGPTTTEAATNGSTQNPCLSKKARKSLRKKNADAVASAQHEPTPIVTVGPTMTDQTATNGSTRSFRLSKKARKALRKREAAATAAASEPATDLHPSDAPDAAKKEPSNDVTENLTIITEAESNTIRATIEARYNALGARLDERHAQ
ncbi:hypothetical protein Q7P36_006385 [Cladosporium allicinum]